VLGEGLAAIRTQFQLPGSFPREVEIAAETAASNSPVDHRDRTSVPFVTLDPASSTDLDQAFAIEASASDLILHYAIADIGWFVPDGSPVDLEAWRRSETIYMPDGKVSLYPPVLSEGAASLLPNGARPAIVFTVRVAPTAPRAWRRRSGELRTIQERNAPMAFRDASDLRSCNGAASAARGPLCR
jgi:exoribonuclease R